jgi:ERCC4-type nuclease
MQNLHLLVDDREHKIVSSIRAVFNGPKTFDSTTGTMTCSTKRLDVGDYVIVTLNEQMVPDQPLAVIERKTLKDYSASLKDGRCDNKEKLLNFRKESKAKIYYLIEGPIDPAVYTLFAGIKYASILSSIYRLQIEDDIAIIRTRSKDHTARELHLLTEMYLRIYSDPTSALRLNSDVIRGAGGNYEESVKKAKLTPEEEFQRSLVNGWATLKGISTNIGSKLATEYSFMQWLKGEIACTEFVFNDRKVNKVVNYLSVPPTKAQMTEILACVRGISKKSAQEIFEVIEPAYFTSDYKEFKYGPKNVKFTKKKYEDVTNYLRTVLPRTVLPVHHA